MSFKGTTALVELPSDPGWDPRTGKLIQRRWRGPAAAAEIGAAELQRAGIRWQIQSESSGGYKTLIGYYGADDTQPPNEPIADLWALAGNDIEKSIWSHPRIAFTASADLDVIALRREFIGAAEAYAKGETTYENSSGETVELTAQAVIDAGTALELGEGLVRALMLSLILGEEAYPVSQWVLRHELVISANSTIRAGLMNVGRMYSTSMLVAVESVPNTIRFDLPEGYWLKRSPTCQQTSSDKWTITQEWWHSDQFDPLLYEMAT